MAEKYDLLLKFIIIGDSGTGKSCLLHQFLEHEFAGEQAHTIGVEFGAKIVKIAEKRVKLQIWDTAGQERYRAVTRSYYRGAAGALVVFDVGSRESFEHVTTWLNDAKRLAGNDIVIMLIGNKSDLPQEKREVPFLEASEFAQKNDILFLETSALTGNNVEQTFLKLGKTIITKIEGGELDPSNNPRGISKLAGAPAAQDSKCSC